MHLLRCGVWAVALFFGRESFAVGACAAAGLFFAAFSLFHDAAHGALRLSRDAANAVLAGASTVLMMSAHAQRHLHLRHHARPLADDDLEGEGARLSLSRALLLGPVLAARMRVAQMPRSLWRWVAVENVINVAVVVAVLRSDDAGLHAALAVALLLHATMSAWASHVPHTLDRRPWLERFARRFTWTRSPVVGSLLHHAEHHRTPKVPCADLGVPGP